jgi:hypothetical protein
VFATGGVVDRSFLRADGFDLGYVQWTHYRPGAPTVTLLEQADPSAVGDYEKLERIAAWEKVIAWAQARQCAEITSYVDDAEAAPADGMSPVRAYESARAEVGLVLTLAPGATAWRVEDAHRLLHEVPAAFAALQTGAITLVKARIIAEGCGELDRAATAVVEQKVLPRASQQTNSQLRAAVQRAVQRADPGACEERRERKKKERGVRLYPERDGVATLSATLPAAEAVGVYAVLDQHARGCGSTDDRRMDARRADALTDLVLRDTGFCSTGSATGGSATGGSATTTGAAGDGAAGESATSDGAAETAVTGAGSVGAAGEAVVLPVAPVPSRLPGIAPDGGCPAVRNSVSVQIRVTVPLTTVQGHGEEPGELVGYGPITAQQARELAADPQSVWRRLVTDPLSGALLDVGTSRYRPPPNIVEHVVARHQYCQYPGCRTPAHRCDLDHNQPHDPERDRGPTSVANLGPKCRPHHRLKGTRGWSVVQYEDGSIVWVTPSGHSYLVEPPPAAQIRAPLPDDDEPPPF